MHLKKIIKYLKSLVLSDCKLSIADEEIMALRIDRSVIKSYEEKDTMTSFARILNLNSIIMMAQLDKFKLPNIHKLND